MAVKYLGIIGIVALLVMGILLQQFSPTTAGPVGILALFGSLYVVCLVIITFTLYVVSRMLARMGSVLIFRRPVQPMSWMHAYYFASVLALLPVIALGLQSVGGVGVYEVFLVGLFGVFGCVYVAKKIT